MTLQELIERLEEYRDLLGEEAEVRLMTQQNWPFENTIRGVVASVELREYHFAQLDPDEIDPEALEEELDPILYLVEGGQLGYGDKAAWELA